MGLFDKLEKGLERTVNGAFAKAFRSEVQPVEIASAIRRAMDEKATQLGSGRTMVPNRYTVELSHGDFMRFDEYSAAISEDLQAAAQEHVESQWYTPGGPIEVRFLEGSDLKDGVFRVRSAASKTPDTGYADSAGPPGASPFERPAADAGHQPSASAGLAPPPPMHQPAAARPGPTHEPPINHDPSKRPWLDIGGERYPLLGSLTVIGRDASADVIIEDAGISRRHSEIRITVDGPRLACSIRDLDSTNGTFVNDERVSSSHLEDGDSIRLGQSVLIFRTGKR